MEYQPARVVMPGIILKRELAERGWSQKDLAEIMDRPAQAINEIIKGAKQITPKTACELAQAFGTSPEFWMNLEMNYQLHKNSLTVEDQQIARRSWLYRYLPVKELIKRQWIKGSPDVGELEKRICSFLEIESIEKLPELTVSLRQSSNRLPETSPVITWVKRVENLVRYQNVKDYDPQLFKQSIPNLLELSSELEKLKDVPNFLNNLGVYFIIVPHLTKTFLDGASFIFNGHPVIALTLRYDRIDSFWFTLLHEAAHIVLGHEGCLDYFDQQDKNSQEQEADQLASEWLINQSDLKYFIDSKAPYISKNDVIHFASDHDRHPGIILGQLHKSRAVSYKNLRGLLVKVSPYLMDWIDRPEN